MPSVPLLKGSITLKKEQITSRTPKGYILPIWGEAPSNPIVTECGLWVPLPNVITCENFSHRANSFWVTEPRKWVFPLT